MSAASIEQHIEQQGGLPLLADDRWSSAATARDRKFTLALSATLILHAVLLIGIATSAPRRVGDANGVADAISISLVTEADLKSMTPVAEQAEPPPGAPAPKSQPTPPPQPPPEAQPQEETPRSAEAKPETPETMRPSISDDVPEVVSSPEPSPEPSPQPSAAPAKKPTVPKPQQQQQQQQQPKPKQTAKLDLSPPATSLNAPVGGGGRSAGFERPPGITRSGANDDFARNVIRELQKTMPQLRDTFGRVTVRIILNQNGNVVDVQVVRSASNPSLDQSVVFAAKQTSYPFPPPNSNDADRTFIVTYIYH